MGRIARYEVVIVGGGIAGAALAYFLAERGVSDVLLLEREPQPGSHATGRSAATLCHLEPNATGRRLKVLSAPFLRHPPAGFAAHPLLVPSGVLCLFAEPSWSTIRQAAPALAGEGVPLDLLSPDQAVARVPALVAERFAGGVLLAEDGHLDVHTLLTGYLAGARAGGGDQRFGVEVRGVLLEGGRCAGVVTGEGEIRARWVVNAAGAWAGEVGALAGATPVPLVPYRRTIVTFAAPEGVAVAGWPLVMSEPHQLYFAPESGGLLFSPMDEEATAPCDARAHDLAVAAGLERLADLAPRLVPRTLRRRWAGLRTFAPDRAPVVGKDPRRPGFFWLAGQGGAGIETSPALGRIAADLVAEGRTGCFDAAALAPGRFAGT